MFRSSFFVCLIFPCALLAQKKTKVLLEIDPGSVNVRGTAYEFSMAIVNGSKKTITIVAPGFYTTEWGSPKSSIVPLGFDRAIYTVRLSGGDCIDPPTDYNSITIFVPLEEKELVTIQPGEKKTIGSIYVNNPEGCFNIDKSKPHTLLVEYSPRIIEPLFTPEERERMMSALMRLRADIERMRALKMMSILTLPTYTAGDLEKRIDYEGRILSRISKIQLVSNSVLLNR